jgi:hypothetical protein
MPQNYINGKSQFTQVADGDGDQQIEAFWAYYSLGAGLPLPVGIEPPGKALAVPVKDRPELLRTFMPDAGTKSFAVGYPGGVNIAFDSGAGRLAYAWSGNFVDAAPVWNDRGGRPAALLGPKFLTPPAGHPWSVALANQPIPDFSARAVDPAFGYQLPNDALYAGPRHVQFQGVSVPPTGEPTFAYQLTEANGLALAVRETPGALPTTVGNGLSRRFTVEQPAGSSVYFLVGVSSQPPRLAEGKAVQPVTISSDAKIVFPVDGKRLVVPVDGRAMVADVKRAVPGMEWVIVPQQGKYMTLLHLPPRATAGPQEWTLHQWGLAREDASLIEALPK